MDSLNREQLRFLSFERHQPCVSIFLPTHRAGPETRQDPIRLKNLTKEAESQLIALGQRRVRAREILAPARQLARKSGFWRQQEDGLALFASDGLYEHFRLPLHFSELVSVAEHFEVSPVLPLFTETGNFYVLALSRNQVRFFRGTPAALAELDIPGMPRSVDEALRYDVRESQLQVHSGAGGSAAGKESAVFTGQGIGVDDEEKRTHEFLLQVDRAARRFLKEEHAPLVLAGVSELLSAYRGVNKYAPVLAEGVTGNPDLLKPHDLHVAAWNMVRPYFEADRKRALTAYQDLAGSSRSSNDKKQVLSSAYQGRIESVFLPCGIQRWGKFASGENGLQLHDKQEPGDACFLRRASQGIRVFPMAQLSVRPLNGRLRWTFRCGL